MSGTIFLPSDGHRSDGVVPASVCSLDDVRRILRLDEAARTIGAGHTIRMTDDVPRRFSIIDTIVALTGKARNHASETFVVLRSELPQVCEVVPNSGRIQVPHCF